LSLSVWLSHQYPIGIPLLPHLCYMLRLSHPIHTRNYCCYFDSETVRWSLFGSRKC
jgi:hypothetical protein